MAHLYLEPIKYTDFLQKMVVRKGVRKDWVVSSRTREQCRKYTQSQSKWSLGQVLVDLGLTLPPTTIYQHGVAIGQYDYASHQLILHNQMWDLSHEV